MNVEVDILPQEINCEENFEDGSLLRILLSTITLHVRFATMRQRRGLSREAHSGNGRRTVLYCGFVAIVCFSRFLVFMTIDSSPKFTAGAGKSILWYAVSRLFSSLPLQRKANPPENGNRQRNDAFHPSSGPGLAPVLAPSRCRGTRNWRM